MYKFSLKSFRGFHEQDFVEIRPLTILVGENSAGKSSFLAALKYMLDFVSGNEEPSFNKDPFQLGTFQQISHFRGGKAGRAREFSISIKRNFQLRSEEGNLREEQEALLNATFISSESQAAISSTTLKSENGALRARVDGERVRVEYIDNNGEVYPIGGRRPYPRVARMDFARYWPFIIRDLRFRAKSLKLENEEDAPLFAGFERPISELTRLAERFSVYFSGHVEATSAIRTKPLRTYTPGIETRDGEGSHVPFEIAKLYRARNKDSWKNLKNSIEYFGKASEMFSVIEVKAFGKTASDPFQIQFSTEGPRTNLVDLGYGTSQVLPILYIVSTGPKKSNYLIQQPEVHLHPKAQAALGQYVVESYINEEKTFVLETHSDYIVDRVRNAISKGTINKDDVSLLFFERGRLENKITKIDLDDNGEPINPPECYRKFFIDEQLKILGVD